MSEVPTMHERLAKQLHESFRGQAPDGQGMEALLRAVSEAYAAADEDRRRLEQRLATAQRFDATGQFAAGVVYEINTPLQFVNDSLQFLSMALAELSAVAATHSQAADVLMGRTLPPADLEALKARITALPELVDVPYLQSEIPPALARCIQGTERVTRTVRKMKQLVEADASRSAFDNVKAALATI